MWLVQSAQGTHACQQVVGHAVPRVSDAA